MTQLQDYIARVQDIFHDNQGIDVPQNRLIDNINEARRRVALDLHCVRNFFPNLQCIANVERYPLSGGTGGIRLISGGQNYINPIGYFTGGGGFGAAATLQAQNGIVTGFTMSSWGQNYTSTPVFNIIDGAGWVTNWQLRQALAAVLIPPNAISTVNSTILALGVNDSRNIQWTSGAPSMPGDSLYAFIQSTLAYSQAQTEALYAQAAAFQSAPSQVPASATPGQMSATDSGQTQLSTTGVTNWQLRTAAANQAFGFIAALNSAVSTSAGDPGNALWVSGAMTGPFDGLAQVMINSLGMTQAQVIAVYSFAAGLVRPAQVVTAQQLRLALAAAGQLTAVIAAISTSPADPANIQWYSAAGTSVGDALYSLVNSVTGAGAIYTAAASFPSNTPGSGALATAISLRNIVDWNQVSVVWGVEKPTLGYEPWSRFQAYARLVQSVPQGRPVIFTTVAENNFAMLFRIPDQNYGLELDAICLSDPLVNLTDFDTQIFQPNDECVKWYTAHLCYLRTQSWGAAQMFEEKYNRSIREIASRRLPSARYFNIYRSSDAHIRRTFGGGY